MNDYIDLFTKSCVEFSDDKIYRYYLSWEWDDKKPTLTYLLLNPSIADQYKMDLTVLRGFHRAHFSGFGKMEVLNLFALISPYPEKIFKHHDPIGPDNDLWLIKTCKASDMVICGWGNDGTYMDRQKIVLGMLRCAGIKLHALGFNKSGCPRHPLYIPYATEPVLF